MPLGEFWSVIRMTMSAFHRLVYLPYPDKSRSVLKLGEHNDKYTQKHKYTYSFHTMKTESADVFPQHISPLLKLPLPCLNFSNVALRRLIIINGTFLLSRSHTIRALFYLRSLSVAGHKKRRRSLSPSCGVSGSSHPVSM